MSAQQGKPVKDIDEGQYPYLKALISSVEEMLQRMALLEAHCVRLCAETDCREPWELGACMPLIDTDGGCIGLAAGRECAARIIARMLGREVVELSEDDIREGMGEVLNIIAGGAKTRLSCTTCRFELSTPVPWEGSPGELCKAHGSAVAAEFEIGGLPFAVTAYIPFSPPGRLGR